MALACAVAVGAASAPVVNAAGADEAPSRRGLLVRPGGRVAEAAQGALYGAKDPKFDGVWRQSLAFLAQDAVGVTPATEAINWLTGQQCADGGFTLYRADATTPCDAKKGEFSDATGAAVQALTAVEGRGAEVAKGLD